MDKQRGQINAWKPIYNAYVFRNQKARIGGVILGLLKYESLAENTLLTYTIIHGMNDINQNRKHKQN